MKALTLTIGLATTLVLLLAPSIASADGEDVLFRWGEVELYGCFEDCSIPTRAPDGTCEDGGDGAEFGWCQYGTDCADCGDWGVDAYLQMYNPVEWVYGLQGLVNQPDYSLSVIGKARGILSGPPPSDQ